MATDAQGRLVQLLITPGQDGDGPAGRTLLQRFEPGRIGHVLADAAYDGDATRAEVRRLKAEACIKPNGGRKKKIRYGKKRYRDRNQVERFFCRIKDFRRVATRYEKKAINFAGFVYLAATVADWL